MRPFSSRRRQGADTLRLDGPGFALDLTNRLLARPVHRHREDRPVRAGQLHPDPRRPRRPRHCAAATNTLVVRPISATLMTKGAGWTRCRRREHPRPALQRLHPGGAILKARRPERPSRHLLNTNRYGLHPRFSGIMDTARSEPLRPGRGGGNRPCRRDPGGVHDRGGAQGRWSSTPRCEVHLRQDRRVPSSRHLTITSVRRQRVPIGATGLHSMVTQRTAEDNSSRSFTEGAAAQHQSVTVGLPTSPAGEASR